MCCGFMYLDVGETEDSGRCAGETYRRGGITASVPEGGDGERESGSRDD